MKSSSRPGLCLALFFFGASFAVAESDAIISGTAFYRERVVLPPGAVFEVVLEDVSRMDVAAEELGRTRQESPGVPPFEFQVLFDPAQVSESHSYAVRARITVDEKLLFTTDQFYPVLTRGHGAEVELLLRQVPGRASVGGEESDRMVADLEDTYWKLMRLGGNAVVVVENQREPHIVLRSEEHRVTGSTGCNRLTGSFTRQDAELSFGQMVTTRMACVHGMETEAAFAAALGEVRAWRIVEDRLELYDADGELLMELEAGALE